MVSRVAIGFVTLHLLASFATGQTQGSVRLRGEITTDGPSMSFRAVLENPGDRNAVVGDTTGGPDGRFEFQGLNRGKYRLVVWINGKKQPQRTFEVVCKPGSTMNKYFFYGKDDTTLMFSFPLEDPNVVDAAELQGNYPRDVLREYERSYEDYIGENYGRAVQRLESIVARAPGFYGAHARLGMIYQQGGCYTDAEAEYAIAVSLSPRSAQPLINLASLQIQAAEESADSMSMLHRALDNLEKALAIKPNSAVARTLSGAASVKSSLYDEAESSFQRALEIDTDMRAARLMLANLYMKQERWKEAIEHLNAYLEDHPFASDRAAVKRMRFDAEMSLKETQQQ
jgi:tetratricopeptide (TPR) repeat protein